MHYNDWKDAEEENVEEHGSGGRDKAYVMFYELELEDGVEVKYAYARQSEKEGPVTVEMKESSPYAVGQIYGHEVESVEETEQKFVYEIRGDHERVQIEATTTVKASRKLNAEEFWDMYMQKQMFGQVLSKRTSEMNPNEIMREVMDGAHERLDLYSMTPFVGGLSDLLNIALYAQEEDYGNAGICAAGVGISFIPGGKIATKVGKAGGKVVAMGLKGLNSIDNYAEVKKAIQVLRENPALVNNPNKIREIITSFDIRTIKVRKADYNEFGIRYFDKPDKVKGHYFFETFPVSRERLAVKPEWNQMTNLKQYQIQPESWIIEGRAAAQSPYLPGGQIQKVVPDYNCQLIELNQ